jgi:hypothetical protein
MASNHGKIRVVILDDHTGDHSLSPREPKVLRHSLVTMSIRGTAARIISQSKDSQYPKTLPILEVEYS